MIEYTLHPFGTMTADEFQKYYEISFHKRNDNVIPANVVIITDNGEYVGFVDFNKVAKTVMYLRYIGFEKFTSNAFRYCKGAFGYIREQGYNTILGSIDASNRLSLLTGLRVGFRINGFKMIDGRGYVDVIMDGEKNLGSYSRGL
jgi:hypothetical protein